MFAVNPFEHVQKQVDGGCFAMQAQASEELWENSQWWPQRPSPTGCAAVSNPDVEVCSTASGSATSLEDDESDSEVNSPPCEAIDSFTAVPQDLFDRLVRAGAAARRRGQHRRVRSPGGSTRLRSSDAMLYCQPPAGAPPPPPPRPVARRLGPCPTSVPPPPPPLNAGL